MAVRTDLEGATEAHALTNLDAFIEEIPVNAEIDVIRRDDLDNGGRFGFALVVDDDHFALVQMPGWELDRVRFIAAPGQDGQYAGVCVDDTNYLWLFATSIVAQKLAGVRR